MSDDSSSDGSDVARLQNLALSSGGDYVGIEASSRDLEEAAIRNDLLLVRNVISRRARTGAHGSGGGGDIFLSGSGSGATTSTAMSPTYAGKIWNIASAGVSPSGGGVSSVAASGAGAARVEGVPPPPSPVRTVTVLRREGSTSSHLGGLVEVGSSSHLAALQGRTSPGAASLTALAGPGRSAAVSPSSDVEGLGPHAGATLPHFSLGSTATAAAVVGYTIAPGASSSVSSPALAIAADYPRAILTGGFTKADSSASARAPVGPTWDDIPVTSPDAFARVVLGTGVGNAGSHGSEASACAALLWRALALRERNWVSRKPAYYVGACDMTSDFPSSPKPPPEPLRHAELGVPLALLEPRSVGAPAASTSTPKPVASVLFDNLAPAPKSPRPTVTVPEPTADRAARLFTNLRRPEPPFIPFKAPSMGNEAGLTVDFSSGVAHVKGGGTMSVLQSTAAGGGTMGVLQSTAAPATLPPAPAPLWRDFAAAYVELQGIVHSAAVKGHAFRRLELLEMRYDLHRSLNADHELTEQKTVPHRDFYNTRKVDTHVHHSACMNQKHLLRFIKSKLRKESQTVCLRRDGTALTLADVFDSLGLTAFDLSIDTLDMHADWTTMHRFDKFNLKYSPIGQSRLREIFLKTNNEIGGRFLAEITREVFSDLEANKYTQAEYRVSIYGTKSTEWAALAKWIVNHSLASPNVRWLIQLPRLYEVYRDTKQVSNFGEMLRNFFEPLFAVTLDPSVDPDLHKLLTILAGVDLVDDESKPEPALGIKMAELPAPDEWNFATGPPYAYWCFYVSSNIAVLNHLRAARGLSQLSFRPHCGEAGDADHLVAAFLTAESINHGINLRKLPSLQYLYYLAQVGLAMSPLSNNRLFIDYNKNPFPEFFKRGLNVSLSTDDPLMLHHTQTPLIEEYVVATQVYKLSAADMAELARNSVLQSGFEYPYKVHWLGTNYASVGPDGNDIALTNVPHIRLQFRLETLQGELTALRDAARK